MLSEILKQDLQVGYNLSCQKLQELILYRLYTDPNEIFDDLFKAEYNSLYNKMFLIK